MAEQNMKVEVKGKAMIITIPDAGLVVSEAGTKLKVRNAGDTPKLRVNDLIATSGGFLKHGGGYTISLNVNRDPAVRLATADAKA